mgnify:CR=1 FL=1
MHQRNYFVEIFSNKGYLSWHKILEVFNVKPPEITSHSLGEVVANAIERQVSVWKTYGPLVFTKETIENSNSQQNTLTKRIIKKRFSVGYVQLSRRSIIYNIESRSICEEYWPKDLAKRIEKPDRDLGEKVNLKAIYPGNSALSPQVKQIIDDLPFMSRIGWFSRLCFPLKNTDEPHPEFLVRGYNNARLDESMDNSYRC